MKESAPASFLQKTAPREILWFYTPFTILIALGELILLLFWMSGEIGLNAFLGAHFILIGFMVLLSWILSKCSCDVRLLLTLSVLCLGLGVMGAFVGVCMVFFYRFYRTRSSQFIGLLEQMFPEEEFVHAVTKCSQRIERGLDNVDSDTTAIPFLDVMSFGSLQQRLRAVALTLRYFHPKLAPVLQKGLRDSNNSVRVLAATSLIAIDQRYQNELHTLQEAVHAQPNKRNLWRALALHAEAYVRTQLLSNERALKVLQIAYDAYQTYVTFVGPTQTSTLAIARLELDMGKLQQARTDLQDLCDKKPPSTEALLLLLEADYRLGNYAALRLVDRHEVSGSIGTELDKEMLKGCALVWSSH